MKILELRFKNLNSLYGEWLIDFSDPEYTSNGIFALIGPTGAGKSTILDAICLALYGATPRLGKITRSGNEIMSRQTGECYAEVVFESQEGRFRCHWEQRCARKRADGKLQDYEHQIIDAESGRPIETKKSLVTGVIEEKTGMDFDRFTRSILLAQGGFDTFLKADVEQKSRILEQITGTEIYSEISRRVHERRRDEQEKLNLLQAETSGIVILTPEQEQEMQQDLEVKQKEEKALSVKSTETGKAIIWLTSIDELQKELSALSKEAITLQNEIEAFKPERDRLDRAVRGSSLDGLYATLTAVRKQQLDDQATLKAQEEALPALKASAQTQAESLRAAEKTTVKAKEELQAAVPLIRKIRLLDQKLAEQQKTISEGVASCLGDEGKIAAAKKARAKEEAERAEAEKTLVRAAGYLNEHAKDEWLVSGLAGVEEQLATLLQRQEEIADQEKALTKADAALQEAEKKLTRSAKQCIARKKEIEEASQNLQKGKESLSERLGDRLLREYRAEKETLLREMVFLRKIEKLEEYRVKLEDGRPCPLCGSREHPFAEGNIPKADTTEEKIESLSRLISKAEDIEAAIKSLEETEAAARKKLNDSEKQEANALSEKAAAVKSMADLRDTLKKIRAAGDELQEKVSDKLQPLGIKEISAVHAATLLESLRIRLNTWQEQVTQKTEIQKKIAALDSELKRLDAVIETQSAALQEKQERLKNLQKEYAAGSEERCRMYGDKQPDHEETHLNTVVTEAEESEKKAGTLYAELQQKLVTAEAAIESLQKRIQQREEELKNVESDFSSARMQAGFPDEEQFLAARLTKEQRDVLSAAAQKLSDAQADLKARQADRQTRLALEKERKITEKPLEELELTLREYEESLQELRNIIAALGHRLRENTAAKERLKEKQTLVEFQKKECHRWDKLHGLIGSADGKKYRNFAQGLTFELMVSHANRQLEKMTDRYLLIRDDEHPLELNAIDNYQAGEIRSTRNLSGGESFIVSLTLALGLSRMASQKVRVDSLFLDEGFGTLDEEALETALETLAGLQQDGKLIGIISHVSALKERIRSQINITPLSGGRSALSGPGCRRGEKSREKASG
ncbi:MAG: AAA family ATPase [Desulfopila sp.]|jgi:exonuclease SbcC|nr:AAA family ATPase [Desulfopila sp.]